MNNDIFSGVSVAVYYATDTGNSAAMPQGMVQIPNLAEFPEFSTGSSTSRVEDYNEEYSGVLLGQKTINDIEINVNWQPDLVEHQFLENAFENKTEFQLIIYYNVNEETATVETVILNGTISGVTSVGSKDSVVTRQFTFVPATLVSQGTRDIPPVLRRGDYGIGANGTIDNPQYQPSAGAEGNALIKIASTASGNPSAVDMMGVEWVDGDKHSNIAITTDGDLRIYAKNNTTTWTRIYTSGEGDTRYLQKEMNLSDLGDITAARTNLNVYSKAQTDNAYLKISQNLADITDPVLARSNLGISSNSELENKFLQQDNNLTDIDDMNAARTNMGVSKLVQLTDSTNLYNANETNFLKLIDNTWGYNDGTNWLALGIGQGGTGATTVTSARINLLIDRLVQSSTDTAVNSPNGNSKLRITNDGTWGAFNTDWIGLGIGQGGTGATTKVGAQVNLGIFPNMGNIGTVNLDTLSTGLWTQADVALATTANNYPVQQPGSLTVKDTGVGKVQYYATGTGLTYTRNYNSQFGTWSTWQYFMQSNSIVSIEQGGTGATTVNAARINLNAAKAGINSDITSLTALNTPISVGSPVNSNDAATKQYVDNLISSGTTGPTLNGVMNWGVGHSYWKHKRVNINASELPQDGQTLLRATYPDLWNYAQTTGLVTDTEWIADVTKRGNFSSGNGTTTFRLPDLNGVQTNSVTGLFVRGDSGVSGSDGTIASSAAPNISGQLYSIVQDNNYGTFSYGNGVFAVGPLNSTRATASGGISNGAANLASFDASRISSVYKAGTTEITPNHVVGVWVIRSYGNFYAANSSWVVINASSTLPNPGVVSYGGTVSSVYQVAGKNYATATLRAKTTIGTPGSAAAEVVIIDSSTGTDVQTIIPISKPPVATVLSWSDAQAAGWVQFGSTVTSANSELFVVIYEDRMVIEGLLRDSTNSIPTGSTVYTPLKVPTGWTNARKPLSICIPMGANENGYTRSQTVLAGVIADGYTTNATTLVLNDTWYFTK